MTTLARRRRERDAAERTIVRETVFARDCWRCRLADVAHAGPCFGSLTFHHLKKESAGGAYTVENGVALCAGHNGWVENNPYAAHELGLVIRAGEECPVTH